MRSFVKDGDNHVFAQENKATLMKGNRNIEQRAKRPSWKDATKKNNHYFACCSAKTVPVSNQYLLSQI
jgi:hypothetical protein